MIGSLFSKTKNLDKIEKAMNEQYTNISSALDKFYSEKENLNYEHGVRMFGDVKDVLQQQINDGVEDLKGNFNKYYEIEFNRVKSVSEQSLIKWIKLRNINPFYKFSTDDFLDSHFEWAVDNFDIKVVSIEEFEVHPIVSEVIKCKNIRDKYFNQIKILNKIGNIKSTKLLTKCHEKSFSILKDKEAYAKSFLVDFNNFIHRNLVFKTYEFEINFEKKEFDNESFQEAVIFFNIIIHLIENKHAGLFVSEKVFIEEKSLEKFNFNKEYWIPKFKHFGIEVIDTE
jgi:hypothetical protein